MREARGEKPGEHSYFISQILCGTRYLFRKVNFSELDFLICRKIYRSCLWREMRNLMERVSLGARKARIGLTNSSENITERSSQ